jgi:predicted transcriptional regulator
MRIPAPLITIQSDDEYRRALQRIAELSGSKHGTIDEAEREGLVAGVEKWLAAQPLPHHPESRAVGDSAWVAE